MKFILQNWLVAKFSVQHYLYKLKHKYIGFEFAIECSTSVDKYASKCIIFHISSILNANNSSRSTSRSVIFSLHAWKHNISRKVFTFPSILRSHPTGSKNFRSTWIGQTCPNKLKGQKVKVHLCQKHNHSKEHYTKREN